MATIRWWPGEADSEGRSKNQRHEMGLIRPGALEPGKYQLALGFFDVRLTFMQDEPEDEWKEWFRLPPLARWRESMKLWPQYLAQGGSLDPNPIHKVLSTFQSCKVGALLMGGQACVFYGAAEFSRDTDFTITPNRPTSGG